jgi:hypothetical protein
MRLAFQMIALLALAAAAQTVEQCVFLMPLPRRVTLSALFPRGVPEQAASLSLCTTP